MKEEDEVGEWEDSFSFPVDWRHRPVDLRQLAMGRADSKPQPSPTHTAATISIGPTVWMRGFSTVEVKGNHLWGWLLPVAN